MLILERIAADLDYKSASLPAMTMGDAIYRTTLKYGDYVRHQLKPWEPMPERELEMGMGDDGEIDQATLDSLVADWQKLFGNKE